MRTLHCTASHKDTISYGKEWLSVSLRKMSRALWFLFCFVLFCEGVGEVVSPSGFLAVSAHSSLTSYSSRFQGMPVWMMATTPTPSFIMDLFCSVFHFSRVYIHASVCVVWVHTFGTAHLCECVGLRLMSGITLDCSSTLCIKSESLCQTQSLPI